LTAAIDAILKGDFYVSSGLSHLGIEGTVEPESSLSKLTPREMELFQLIGEGMTSGAIAKKPFLSSHTIDTHRENIKRKLRVKNAAELIRQSVVCVENNGVLMRQDQSKVRHNRLFQRLATESGSRHSGAGVRVHCGMGAKSNH